MKDTLVKLEDVHKLTELFQTKNWFSKPNNLEVMDNFCVLLSNLSQNQKELIHELSQQYLWITGDEYTKRFNHLLQSFDANVLKKCQKIYLFPIIKPAHEKEIKSGNHCIYLFRGLFPSNPNYRDIQIEVVNSFVDLIDIDFRNDGSDLLFLVDDFIGSGETFEEAWLEANKNPSIAKGITYVLTLVIQNEAFDFIFDNYGLSPIYTETRGKGITDLYTEPLRDEKTKTMEDIEKLLNVRSCNFGYSRSEALVTMIRTPDNTFPVFWKKYKLKGIEFIPPFLRD